LQECYTCVGTGSGPQCDVVVNPYDCTGYRLLTEAEWEGAARCGADTLYAGSDTAADVAWTVENSNSSTHTVAGLAPNACGLYDMSGNVWEWTQDGYEEYPSGAVTDPVGAESGANRVLRGGGWPTGAGGAALSSRRYDVYPGDAFGDLGFRLSRSSP
jgi:formylglycine-generating enzyme required for sulfatase activity